MRKNVFKVMVLLGLSSLTGAIQAQSLGNLLKSVEDAVSGTSASEDHKKTGIGSFLNNLIGVKKVTASHISGTWKYERPAIAFESENLLNNAGGTIISNTLEKKLQTYLTKIGFTPGKVKITFLDKEKFTMQFNQKTIEGAYMLEGSTITFMRTGEVKSVSANIKVESKDLQITFKADKLLEFMTVIASSSTNATLKNISKIAANYSGMQMGFKFNK